jgi:hypothetical protein
MSGIEETTVYQSKLSKGFAFHTNLNPLLWDGDEMRPDIRLALVKAARAFYDFLGIPGLRVEDIIFTGSNAAFNYTDFSDIDLHLIVNFNESSFSELAENLFTTKKTLWNRLHAITIKGYGLELYVEDTANPVTAQGVFSVLKGKWVHKPKAERPQWDDASVASKVEALADQIDDLLAATNPAREDIDRMTDRIRKMRRSGLAKGGEFSIENLAFKGLRNLGYLDRLWQARVDSEDRTLSLEAEFD